MSESTITPPVVDTMEDKPLTFVRFKFSQRVEHFVFLISFSLLGLTGLVQKFSDGAFSQWFFQLIGGIEKAREIHHFSAFIMMIVSGYHILSLLYKVFVLRLKWTIFPVVQDLLHVIQDVLYYVGIRKHRAYYDRYNYAEKMEYLAVVWGTFLMGLTGFMMWNPITTTRFLPGEIIPAAKAAHGGEAVLAVLAIIVWHFYHVHIRTFNKSMFTGKLTREEMHHEHPAELAAIEAGVTEKETPITIMRRRQLIYYPAAIFLTITFAIGTNYFLNVETTAIDTVPEGETAQVFVPVTPTPRPTPLPSPTPEPSEPVEDLTWVDYVEGLTRNRCSTCHGFTKVGGLTLATYQDALTGGNSGPAVVPEDPDDSTLVQIQSMGGHPGQLTDEELDLVIQWINAGAPER